ncbi:hypothetical protein GOBAR_AA25001 [Gossypium barbadense]|uniref:Uncharacterized protein n=1 Tax=Gossypium barbadense TaxID=3634 RepID=A0A2P5WX66_GOSBA|nr:hypothetical protein GOBAR_AA25001 [Gossypium barbadense]
MPYLYLAARFSIKGLGYLNHILGVEVLWQFIEIILSYRNHDNYELQAGENMEKCSLTKTSMSNIEIFHIGQWDNSLPTNHVKELRAEENINKCSLTKTLMSNTKTFHTNNGAPSIDATHFHHVIDTFFDQV